MLYVSLYVCFFLNLLDILRIFLSRLCDAVCLRFAIFQPDDRHRILAKFCCGSNVDHVDTGNHQLIISCCCS